MASTGEEMFAQAFAADKAQEEAAKNPPPALPVGDYKAENEKLIQQLGQKDLGENYSKYQQAVSIAQKQPQFQIQPEARINVAKYSFKQQKGYEATDQEAKDFLEKNQATVEKNLYASLADQARSKGIDLSGDKFYQGYVSDTVKANTPKEVEESFGEKAKRIAKNIFLDTPVGVGALSSDTLFGTNYYKGYFGKQTNLAGNEGFGKKFTDLMINQGAIVDAGIAVGSLATGGLGAPALVGMKAGLKGGVKNITKDVFKTVEKGALKQGLGEFESQITKEMGTDFVKIMKGEGNIAEHLARQTVNPANYLSKAKNVMREAGLDVLKGADEAVKTKFMSKLDTTFDVLGARTIKLSSTQKTAEGLNVMIDALGLPNFIGFQAMKIGDKEVLKYNRASFIKTMFNYAVPASPLIPGVGDWMETTGLRLGSILAHKFTEQTRGGLVDSERQKFIDQYGIDPEKSEGSLRANWENFVNYKLKNSTFSEALTGIQRESRSTEGQWGYGILDTAVDFVGPMFGIKAFGKANQAIASKLSPITTKDGEFVSNIDYIRRLEIIQEEKTGKERVDEIEKLNEEAKTGKFNTVLNTIKSAKDLENVKNEMLEFRKTGEQFTEHEQTYWDMVSKAIDLKQEGKHEDATKIMDAADTFLTHSADIIFNPERMKSVKEKADLISSYFDGIRNSFSFVDTMAKGLATNLYTKSILSETGAIIRGGPAEAGKARALFGEITDTNEKLAEVYKKRSEAKKTVYSTESAELEILRARIEDGLINDGIPKDTARSISQELQHTVGTVITKVYLGAQSLGKEDYKLGQLFDRVFKGWGVPGFTKKLTENAFVKVTDKLGSTIKGNEGFIMQARTDNESMNKLEDSVVDLLTSESRIALGNQENIKEAVSSIAQELMTYNRLKADIASKIHQRNELLRQKDMFQEPVSKTADLNEIQKQLDEQKKKLEELEAKGVDVTEQKKEVTETLEKVETLKEETSNKDDEAEVIIKGGLTPEEKTAILENPNIENIRSTDAHIEVVQEKINDHIDKVETKITQVESDINKLSETMANLASMNVGFNKFLLREDQNPDTNKADRFEDDYFRQEEMYKTTENKFLRDIDNYNAFIKTAFKNIGDVSLDGLKLFNPEFIHNLRKTAKETQNKLTSMTLDDTSSPRKIEVLSRTLDRIIESGKTDLNRDTFMDLAHKSDTYQEFIERLHNFVAERFGFLPERVDEFIKNSFGTKKDPADPSKTILDPEQVIPFYSLYKNTTKINIAKLDLDQGKVYHSNGDAEEQLRFLDENGNMSSVYRLEGIQSKELNKHFDTILLKDITYKGKSVTAKNVFGGAFEDVNANDEWNSIWSDVQEHMKKEGYAFLGSFQEEGKKLLFVREKGNKEPIVTDEKGLDIWYKAMKDLTGINFIDINNIKNEDVRYQVMANFTKYAKLLLWSEVKIDKNIFYEKTGRFKTNDLVFDDTIPLTETTSDGIQTKDYKMFDGRVLTATHYQEVINQIIGAHPANDTHKTASSVGDGVFVKSQDGRINDSTLIDPRIRSAIEMFAKREGIRQDILANPNWWESEANRITIASEIFGKKLIDRIVPLSALKNIYTRGMEGDKKVIGIRYNTYEPGQVFNTDVTKIGLKTHDQFKGPKDAEKETISASNQLIRAMNADYILKDGTPAKDSIDPFIKLFNDIRGKDYDDLIQIMSTTGKDPVGVIAALSDRFGSKFTDFEGHEFMTTRQVDNIIDMASNIWKRHTRIGTTLKGNKLDLTYIPYYEKVRDSINALPSMKNQQDNFIIMDKDVYGHLEKANNERIALLESTLGREATAEEKNLRYVMFRYPVVNREVVTAPVIIWLQDLPTYTGIPGYKPHLGSAAAPSHKVIKRIEGDGDGDSIYLITDQRFQEVNDKIFKYVDSVFADKTVKEVDAVKKTLGGEDKPDLGLSPTMSPQDMFRQLSFNIFEGKSNVGKISTDSSRFETYVKLGLITDPETINTQRALNAKNEQSSVDSVQIDVRGAKKQLRNAMGHKIEDFATFIPNEAYETVIRKSDGTLIFPGYFEMRNVAGKNIDETRANNTATADSFLQIVTSLHNALKDAKGEQYQTKKNGKVKNHYVIDLGDGINTKLSKSSLEQLEQLKEIIHKNDLKAITKAVTGVYNFIGKYDYKDGFSFAKTITNISRDTEKVMDTIRYLESIFGDNIYKDPNIDFIVKKSEAFQKGFPEFRRQLSLTVSEAFDKASLHPHFKNKSDSGLLPSKVSDSISEQVENYRKTKLLSYNDYQDFWDKQSDREPKTKEEKENKAFADILDNKNLGPNLSGEEFLSKKKEALNMLKTEFHLFVAQHPEVNIDYFIIDGQDGFGGPKQDLLTAEGRDVLNREMTKHFYMAPTKIMNEFLKGQIDMDSIMNAFGKTKMPEFMKVFNDAVKNYDKYVDDFNNDSVGKAGLTGPTARIMARMHVAGIPQEEIKASALALESYTPAVRKEIFTTLPKLDDKDLKTFASVFTQGKEHDIVQQEILKLRGIKIISNNIILDDAATAKDIVNNNPIETFQPTNPC